MGEEWAREWSRWCAARCAPQTPAQRYAAIPLEGWGPDTRPRPTVIRGAGPDQPVGRGDGGMAASSPGAANRMDWGRVLTRQDARPLPHRPSGRQRTPGYGYTQMGTHHGHRLMAPPRGRGRPARRGALQSWGAGIQRRPVPAGRHPGALAPHAPHRHCSRAAPGAGQRRRAASAMGGSRGRHPTGPPPPGRRKQVPIGYAGAPPHRAPRVHGNPPPRGSPAQRGTTSSPPSTTTGFSPTTRGRRSSRRRSAGTSGAASAPACLRSRTPSDRGGTTSGSAISTLGRRPPTSGTPAGSAGNVTRCPPQRRQAPTGARGAPRWPRAPGANLPQARAGARRRRPCTGALRGHMPPHKKRAGPTGAALLWIHVHLRDPTSVAHLSHVFAP